MSLSEGTGCRVWLPVALSAGPVLVPILGNRGVPPPPPESLILDSIGLKPYVGCSYQRINELQVLPRKQITYAARWACESFLGEIRKPAVAGFFCLYFYFTGFGEIVRQEREGVRRLGVARFQDCSRTLGFALRLRLSHAAGSAMMKRVGRTAGVKNRGFPFPH